MALTPDQIRSMDNYLYKTTMRNKVGSKPKNEAKRQETQKSMTEDILDNVLKQTEESCL